MTVHQLIHAIREKKSYLCVGLDTDIQKLPAGMSATPESMLRFNQAIIDATLPYCVSYKINTAFYEALGAAGWEVMAETIRYIPPTHFVIADAKRGDIGNTSSLYARAFFEQLGVDAVTVAPYMGEDSIRPFLEYHDKVTIVLGLTSNGGAKDFELLPLAPTNGSSQMLYERVIEKVAEWGTPSNLMFVTGATQAGYLKGIRSVIPEHFLLVPGVGFQGGSLQEVSREAMNTHVGLLVNASRAVIYASRNEDFAQEAAIIAQQYQVEMAGYLDDFVASS